MNTFPNLPSAYHVCAFPSFKRATLQVGIINFPHAHEACECEVNSTSGGGTSQCFETDFRVEHSERENVCAVARRRGSLAEREKQFRVRKKMQISKVIWIIKYNLYSQWLWLRSLVYYLCYVSPKRSNNNSDNK